MQHLDSIMKVIEQIVILGLLGLAGFIAGRTKYLPENSGIVLSRFVVKVTMPLLLLTTFIDYKFSYKVILDGGLVYISGIAVILLSFLISVLIMKGLRLPDATRNVYSMCSMFGNVVFLAFPLLGALFGEKGIVYAIFFQFANDTILWTLGIFLVNRHTTSQWKDNLKHFINGNTIAIFCGLLSIIFQWKEHIERSPFASKMYSLAFEAFHPLGKTTTVISMIFIGLILSEIRMSSLSDILKRYPVFILSVMKLLFVPFLAVGLLWLTGDSMDPFVKAIVVLQAAMPTGTIIAALAAQYESDYKFVTESVFFTTIFSILTLPFLVYVLQLLGWISV